MKKIFLTVISMLVLSTAGNAQIRNIQIDIHGNYELLIEVGREQYVAMIDDGTIVDMKINGDTEYHTGATVSDPRMEGKVKRVGDIDFEYYEEYEENHDRQYKIKRIGKLDYDYRYTLAWFDNCIAGKLTQVGTQRISYYNELKQMTGIPGKVSSIDSFMISYYTDNYQIYKVDERKIGLIKSIEGNNYDYAFPSDDDSDGRGSDDRRGHERGGRRRMIGPTTLKNNGVTLTIENRR